MKNLLILSLLLVSVAASAQLKLNASSSLYEHVVEIESKDALVSRLEELNVEVADDLKCKGYFSALVKGIAPVEIHYIGKERDGKFVLTAFALKGGASSAMLNLEEAPKKAKRHYIEIINSKIQRMAL